MQYVGNKNTVAMFVMLCKLLLHISMTSGQVQTFWSVADAVEALTTWTNPEDQSDGFGSCSTQSVEPHRDISVCDVSFNVGYWYQTHPAAHLVIVRPARRVMFPHLLHAHGCSYNTVVQY